MTRFGPQHHKKKKYIYIYIQYNVPYSVRNLTTLYRLVQVGYTARDYKKKGSRLVNLQRLEHTVMTTLTCVKQTEKQKGKPSVHDPALSYSNTSVGVWTIFIGGNALGVTARNKKNTVSLQPSFKLRTSQYKGETYKSARFIWAASNWQSSSDKLWRGRQRCFAVRILNIHSQAPSDMHSEATFYAM